MSHAEIASVNRAFEEASRKQDGARIAALYTADAMLLPPEAGKKKDGQWRLHRDIWNTKG